MKHRLAGEIDWVDAPAENFTGTVQFGPLSQHGALDALAVRFESGPGPIGIGTLKARCSMSPKA